MQIAEDAVQEATLAALGAWPVTGVPPEPRAWLTVTARRKAIDILRRERARRGKERDGAADDRAGQRPTCRRTTSCTTTCCG